MANRNSAYWKKRFEQLEASQHQQGLSAYSQIESQYRQAQRTIEGKITAWYQRFADNNSISMSEAKKLLTSKELAEFKWDVNDYIKYGEENAVSGTWAKQLENASARYHISRLEALKIQTQQSVEVLFGNQLDMIDTAMKSIYTSGYYHTAFEIQKGVGVGWDFTTLDDKTISKVINKPWAVDGKNFSERIWGSKEKLINELNQTLTQNIILGQDPKKAIDAIAKKMNVSKANAGRLVMTEEAYFSSEAQKDCFDELDVEMFEVVATLDNITSDICQSMDGKVFKMSEWEVGVTAPPFHPNCRTTTVPAFGDEFDKIGERAARSADGKTYHVPADTTYKEWEKAFVDGDKSGLQEVKEDDTITFDKTVQSFLDGSTDRTKLGEEILKQYGVSGVPVNVKKMSDWGNCQIMVDGDGNLQVCSYNLNANDQRGAKYQLKTAFHEAYHASGNGYATDVATLNRTKWLNIEETFAESSAYYMSSLYGVTDLAPSYAEKLVTMLPRLKKLPEFSSCSTIADFGKVAQAARQAGGGSTWKTLSSAAMKKKFSYSDYISQYFETIRADVPGYVDKILENMPTSKPYRSSMISDLEKAMDNVDKLGFTLSDNQSLMLNNAVAVAMNRIGVK